jgi:DNA-3-methyladenine glycosylase II
MFLVFVLGRQDVFPVEDLGIRNAMRELYGIEDREEMRDKAEDWKPHRSLASLYLWRAVD